jgi:hypothetical protein
MRPSRTVRVGQREEPAGSADEPPEVDAMTSSRWLMSLGMGTLVLAGCPDKGSDEGDTDTDETGGSVVHSDPDSDTEVPVDSDTEIPLETDTDTVPDSDSDTWLLPHTGDGDTDSPFPQQLLLLTEIGDYSPTVKYVEICNPNDVPVPLAGWKLGRLGTGSASYTPIFDVELDPGQSIGPGEAWLVALDPTTSRTFLDTWGGDALPDQYDADVVLGDGNDPYALYYGTRRIDVFGDPATTAAWYANEVAARDEAIRAPRPIYRPADWTIDAFASASPGLCFGAVAHTDPPSDSDLLDDTFDTSRKDTFDTSPIDTDPHLDIRPISELAPGDVVITEFMPATDIQDCEYLTFVVTANSLSPFPNYVDLNGLVLSDQAGHSWTFTGSLQVIPGMEIIAMPEAADDEACYLLGGGSLRYSGFDLTDAGDTIQLRNGTEILDQVSYAGWTGTNPNNKVRAWQLDREILSADDNDDEANWCLATTKITGFPDFGSPGWSNDDCQAIPPETGDTSIDSDTTDDTLIDTGHTDVVVPPKTLGELAEGDLVITEFASNPNLTSCGTAPAEYVEIMNATSDWVDLDGLEIRVGATTATISGTSLIGPVPASIGGTTTDPSVVVLAQGPLESHCFANNLTLALRGRSFPYTNTIDLPEGGGTIQIAFGATVFDTVDSTSWTPTSNVGQAWNLADSKANAVDNDTFSSWCGNGFAAGPLNVGSLGGVFGCGSP